MNIFPAIDLYDGKVVRLYQGDYRQMTVYDEDPLRVARAFLRQGAKYLHIVDLLGAKEGRPCDFSLIQKITSETGLRVEIGGGVRDMKTVEAYLDAGVERVILGTAAVTDPAFLSEAAARYAASLAVGIDVRDGFVAIKGWTEKTEVRCEEMFASMTALGISRIICTDISKDGAMKGTNLALYAELVRRFPIDIVASGGVSDLSDVQALREIGLFGAIIGKAYYTGAVSLTEAIRIAQL